jgi:hypothetical protein
LEDWRRAQGGRADQRVEQGQQRIDQGAARETEHERHNRETEGQGRARIDLARTKEGRLDRQGLARQDQRYAELELKRHALANQFQKTKNGETARQWRQALDAERQYTRTIIGASQLAGEEKKKLLQDNDAWHTQQIREMQKNTEGTFDNKFTPAESMPPAIQQGQ